MNINSTIQPNGFLNCNFDDSYAFQLITKQDINLEAFTSCRIKFQFSLYLKQMLIFEPTENIQGLGSDIAAINPGFCDFQELILQNQINEDHSQESLQQKQM